MNFMNIAVRAVVPDRPLRTASPVIRATEDIAPCGDGHPYEINQSIKEEGEEK